MHHFIFEVGRILKISRSLYDYTHVSSHADLEGVMRLIRFWGALVIATSSEDLLWILAARCLIAADVDRE